MRPMLHQAHLVESIGAVPQKSKRWRTVSVAPGGVFGEGRVFALQRPQWLRILLVRRDESTRSGQGFQDLRHGQVGNVGHDFEP